jgi:feruloyl esterase
LRQILDATDPDLLAFRKHGGKLLMYFGWADPGQADFDNAPFENDVLAAVAT